MSKLYVNKIYPQSGDWVAVSGNLDVSGTLTAYEFNTIVQSETTYLGSNAFGNDSTDVHAFTGSIEFTGSGVTLTGAEAGSVTLTFEADQSDDSESVVLTAADGGAFTIDSTTSTVTVDGHAGVTITSSNSGEVDITSAAAVDINATTGVTIDGTTISIDGTDDVNLTVTSSTGGEDLTISQVGANDSSILITAAGTGTDAISIDATAGDMVIGPSLINGKTLTLGNTSSTYLKLIPHGTAASEKVLLYNAAGTADDAIKIHSDAGGVTIKADNDSLVLDADGTDADALNIDSAGGIDVDAAGAISLDSSGGSIDINVVDGQTVSVGLNGAVETIWTPHGTAGSELWSTINTSGTTDGADAAGAILLSAVAGGIGLAWADDKDLWAEGGQFVVTANHDASGAIKLHADAGTSQTIQLLNDAGTASTAIDLEATAGGFSIDGVQASNITVTSAGDADDLTISVAGANDASLILSSAGTGADAMSLDVTAGSMVVAPSLADGQTLKLGKNGAVEVVIAPHGTAGSEKYTVTNTAGTAADAIGLVASAGGITLDAETDIVLDANGADVSLKDNGTQFLKFTNNSGDCEIYNGVADKDIVFKDLGGNTIFTIDGAHESIVMADDKKIYFGSDEDASIEYDEDGTDELIISGSAGGIDIMLHNGVADGMTISTSDGAFWQLNTDNGLLTHNGDVLVADDKKLYFGTNEDAHIEYDENNTNKLIISGAAGGFDIDLPDNVSNAFRIGETGATPYIAIDTTNSDEMITFSKEVDFSDNVHIKDNKKLIFGTNEDASIEYDEDGTDELIISGSAGGVDIMLHNGVADGMTISTSDGAFWQLNTDNGLLSHNGDVRLADDKKLYFGTNEDASIEYDENGTDELIISGAAGGVDLMLHAGVTDAFTISTSQGAALTLNTTNSLFTYDGDIRVNDDHKLYFGTNEDASIEYDENGTDELIISGAAGGVDIMLHNGVADGMTISTSDGAFWQLNTDNGLLTHNGDVLVADDKKLYFGTNEDAHIEYDENNTNKLILSGAASGFDIDLPDNVGGAFRIMEEGTAYVTIDTTNSDEMITFSKEVDFSDNVHIKDDKKLIFGTNEDASIEYDEDGNDELIISGSAGGVDIMLHNGVADGMTISTSDGAFWQLNTDNGLLSHNGDVRLADDKKLYFGTNEDAHIEYDEDNTNKLILSGAASGFDIDLPDNVGGAFRIMEEGTAYMTIDTTNSDEMITFSKEVDFSANVHIGDDKKLIFGTNEDASIEYDEDGTDELIISGSAGGVDIMLHNGVADGMTISTSDGAFWQLNTNNGLLTHNGDVMVADDKKLYFGTNEDANVEYDENGTNRLILTIPEAGMSIGKGFHRVAQDVNVNKAHSGDNTVANQLHGVFIPNNSIITRVVAIPSTLSNLGTAVYNLSISATNDTAADSSVSTPTEILGAGASGTEDSDGGSATDIVMSSGGTNKKVWMSDTKIKTTYDAYVYVANAGTGNGTTDPSQGTLHVIIEYYGLE